MINWASTDTILLDLDGTLLDLHFDNYFWQTHLIKRYAEKHRVPQNIAKEQLFAAFKAVEGTQNWYCLDYWQDLLGLDIVALKHEVQHLIAIHPHVEAFLSFARNHKHIVLVTNAHRGSLDLKMDNTGLDQYFDEVISAHDFGEPKEEMAFWHKLSQHIRFDKNRSLLVEDNLQVLRTAQSYGIAQLIAITQPDSQAQERPTEEFQSAKTFKELLPDDLE